MLKRHSKSGGTVKDGMDICLLVIDKASAKIGYAGAHNALWILSQSEQIPNATVREDEGGYRMFEIKADRQSIGDYFDVGPFTDKRLNSEMAIGYSCFQMALPISSVDPEIKAWQQTHAKYVP